MNGWDAYERRPMWPAPTPDKPRSMACACGGSITVSRKADGDALGDAVRSHQRTRIHRRWAEGIER